MNISELVMVIGMNWRDQSEFLGKLPENAKDSNFVRKNQIDELIQLFFDSISPIDDSEGFEGFESWIHRTGIPESVAKDRTHQFWKNAEDLATLLYLIKESPRDMLFTRQGLRSSSDWKLVRKFAAKLFETDFLNESVIVTNLSDLKKRLLPH